CSRGSAASRSTTWSPAPRGRGRRPRPGAGPAPSPAAATRGAGRRRGPGPRPRGRRFPRASRRCARVHRRWGVSPMRRFGGAAHDRRMSETNPSQSPSDPKIESVQRMYQAFGRGDVDAVLAELADGVEWISVSEAPNPVVPWYGRYQGKGEVPRFFKEIGSNVDVTEFNLLSVTSSDTDVMVAIRWGFTVRATGKNVD